MCTSVIQCPKYCLRKATLYSFSSLALVTLTFSLFGKKKTRTRKFSRLRMHFRSDHSSSALNSDVCLCLRQPRQCPQRLLITQSPCDSMSTEKHDHFATENGRVTTAAGDGIGHNNNNKRSGATAMAEAAAGNAGPRLTKRPSVCACDTGVRYWSAAAARRGCHADELRGGGAGGGLGCSRALRAYWVSEQFQLLPLVTSAPPAGVVGRGAS